MTEIPDEQSIGIITKYSLINLTISYSGLVSFVIMMKQNTWSTNKIFSIILIQILVSFE